MKLKASVIKTTKENIRDWKVLVLVLIFSPFFIFLMYLFYGDGATVYKVGVINADETTLSKVLIESLSELKGQDEANIMEIIYYNDPAQLKEHVKTKGIDLGIEIPKGYAGALTLKATDDMAPPAFVNFYGSTGNMNYAVAAILASDLFYQQGLEIARISLPSEIRETFLEKKQQLNGFDSYVPGGISLAILMILFTACASIVKESDKKTLLRLKLSQLGAFNFLAGISIVQAVIGTAALILSYLTALGLGYAPVGGFGAVLVVGAVSSLSIVAISLIASSFFKTIFDVLTVGCFPFFILMFFSGGMFPVPKIPLFKLFGHTVGITDFLPLTQTVNAFNKILNDGAAISDVGFELATLVILTMLYMTIGVLLYQKRKLSKA